MGYVPLLYGSTVVSATVALGCFMYSSGLKSSLNKFYLSTGKKILGELENVFLTENTTVNPGVTTN